ncbi:cytochrome P450 [Mycobacterium sp. M26]|uniref:cytochrome P450 n=1 Tax=Mycobacterium sp. M26 TaxID=1762962 RepID=UPI000AD1E6B0|nr:cytochrome P450 [Mycobacterium sp. M26]
MGEPTSAPPRVRLPKLVQGVEFAVFRRRAMRRWIKRHGRIFEMNIPFFGRSVVVSDPALIRAVCSSSPEQLANVQPNVGNWFGPGSLFALDGSRHRARRRLLAPAFHGRALTRHTAMIEDETLREVANWPQNVEFRTLEPMSRITLNVILRSLFGSDGLSGAELEMLRATIPPYVRLGQLLAFVPGPPAVVRRHSPWRRMDAFRAAFDRVVFAHIAAAEADPALDVRTDILALLVRARREDEAGVSCVDISDELLTLICAGHETTAAALSWLFERLRRHPQVLAELVDEVDAGGHQLRRAAIAEVLRSRTVIDVAGRRVITPDVQLGGWRVAQGATVLVRIADLHDNEEVFAHPERYEPQRFCGERGSAAGLAFGGGTRRCLGADFATTEMDVVLRIVLQNFRIHTDAAADEKSSFHGIAHVPKRGGRITVSRRGELLCRPS